MTTSTTMDKARENARIDGFLIEKANLDWMKAYDTSDVDGVDWSWFLRV